MRLRNVHMVARWNSQTGMYQAKVDYKGKTLTFPLADASTETEARSQAEHIMRDYIQETRPIESDPTSMRSQVSHQVGIEAVNKTIVDWIRTSLTG